MVKDGVNFVDRHVGERVGQLRKDCLVKGEELAQALGVEVADLEAFENGEARLGAATLYKISKFFGVKPGYFFDALPDPSSPSFIPVAHSSTSEESPSVEEWATLRIAFMKIREKEIRTHLIALAAAATAKID